MKFHATYAANSQWKGIRHDVVGELQYDVPFHAFLQIPTVSYEPLSLGQLWFAFFCSRFVRMLHALLSWLVYRFNSHSCQETTILIYSALIILSCIGMYLTVIGGRGCHSVGAPCSPQISLQIYANFTNGDTFGPHKCWLGPGPSMPGWEATPAVQDGVLQCASWHDLSNKLRNKPDKADVCSLKIFEVPAEVPQVWEMPFEWAADLTPEERTRGWFDIRWMGKMKNYEW